VNIFPPASVLAIVPSVLLACSSGPGSPDVADSGGGTNVGTASASSSGGAGTGSSSGSGTFASGGGSGSSGGASSSGSSSSPSAGSSGSTLDSSSGTGPSSSFDGGGSMLASSSGGGTASVDADLGSSTSADSGGGAEGGIAAGPGATDHSRVWRITPIGDSITEDTCGPQLLSQELIQNGHTNFVFVGTETNNQSCSGAPNIESEGHAGYLVTDLLPPPHVPVLASHYMELPQWAANDKSDVLTMQFGTNDVWNNVATQSILDAYTLVLTDYRAVNPNVTMFVAQITPLNPSGCGSCEANVVALNAAIPGWAASQSTAASPVYVVDLWSAFTASSYVPDSTVTVDGVHPNPAGAALIAQKWYEALIANGIP
jgi:lysophospholipase L1-like esterase